MVIEIIKTIHNLRANRDPLVDQDLITVSPDGSDEIYKTTVVTLAVHIVHYSAGRLGIFKNMCVSTHIANAHAVPKLSVGLSEGADIATSMGGPHFPNQLFGQLSSDALAFPDFIPPTWAPWWLPFNHTDLGGGFFTLMPGYDTHAFTPPLTNTSITESAFSVYMLDINLGTNPYSSVTEFIWMVEIGFMYYEGDPPVLVNTTWLALNAWQGFSISSAMDHRIAISAQYTVNVPNGLTVKRWYVPCYAWTLPCLNLYFDRQHSTFRVVRLK